MEYIRISSSLNPAFFISWGDSTLLKGLPIHLVMVGPVSDESSAQLDWAQKVLLNAGFTVRAEALNGEIEPTLHAYQKEHGIDLLVMGA